MKLFEMTDDEYVLSSAFLYFGNRVDVLFVHESIMPTSITPTTSLLTALSVHISYAHPVARVRSSQRGAHSPLGVIFGVFELESRVEAKIEVFHSPCPVSTYEKK